MSCFGGPTSPDLYQNCCNSNIICEFDGDMSNVVSEPIYVQKVFDAVKFNLQGMKSMNCQEFTPAIPAGYRVRRVVDIRCKKVFNPSNVDDSRNLTLDVDTSISGATFLQDQSNKDLLAVGADGLFSEKILYADTTECDDQCMGTPVFGTQTISISGNVIVEIDLLLCDGCNNELLFTVCAEVNIASEQAPLILTNFFEICMPSTIDTAFFPRFTEFCNSACETRLATNNFGRDLNVDSDGVVSANLIIALCVTCEKKIVVPVQLCVLSTGYVDVAVQNNAICTTFPSLFPRQIKESDTEENCPEVSDVGGDRNCRNSCGGSVSPRSGGNSGCCEDDCCCDGDFANRQARRPQPRH